MTTVRLFLEFFLVYQDWRFLSVPLWGVILYGAVTVAATPHFYSDSSLIFDSFSGWRDLGVGVLCL